jgi:hypothetical protein
VAKRAIVTGALAHRSERECSDLTKISMIERCFLTPSPQLKANSKFSALD